MMRQAPTLNAEVQSLSQIHEAVARAQAVLKGDFRKELEQMKALREELAERQGAIDTVEKAATVKREADEYALKVRAEAEAYKGAQAEALSKAAAKLATVEAREAATAQAEEALERRSLELDAKRDAILKGERERAAVLEKRSTLLAAQEADLAKRKSAIEAKERTLVAAAQALSVS